MSATITRDELAILLENEAHNGLAQDIRSGRNPRSAFTEPGHVGLLRKLREPRYLDGISAEAVATFKAVYSGELGVVA